MCTELADSFRRIDQVVSRKLGGYQSADGPV